MFPTFSFSVFHTVTTATTQLWQWSQWLVWGNPVSPELVALREQNQRLEVIERRLNQLWGLSMTPSTTTTPPPTPPLLPQSSPPQQQPSPFPSMDQSMVLMPDSESLQDQSTVLLPISEDVPHVPPTPPTSHNPQSSDQK